MNFRYNLHGLINISSGIFDLSVGTIILLQRRNSRVNQSFFLITVASFLWVVGFGLLSLASNIEDAYKWARIAYVGIPLISPSVFLFSQYWVRRTTNRLTPISFGLAFITILPPVLAPERLFRMVDHSWGRYIRVGGSPFSIPYYSTLIFVFVWFAILAIRNFYAGWKTSPEPLRRVQFRSVFFAFVVAYGGSVDFAVKLGLDLYPSGCIWLSSLILFIAYTILRHRTLDINLGQSRFGLLALIYSALIAIGLPFTTSILRDLSSLRNNHDVLLTVFLIGGGALFLSTGPAIYAYVVGQRFWLKQHVTSALTHELKSPIGAIRGAIELIQSSTGMESPKTVPYIEMLVRNTSRLEQYVTDLLTVLKQNEHGLSARKVNCDVHHVLESTVASFIEIAQNKGISISLKSNPGLVLFADQIGISQIVSNLLSNSIRFSDTGLVRVEADINEVEITVKVIDQGRGIRNEDLPHIFDQFYQGHGATRGTGLGLAIAKGWVDSHGGNIWADSKGEGMGTTITFTLPTSQ